MADREQLVPKAEDALDRLKYEVADDIGVDLRKGGDLTTREAGKVGGQMMKRLIRRAEQDLAHESEDRR